MKLEQTGGRQWKVTTSMDFTFTFGEALDNEDLFEVFTKDIKIQLHLNTYIGNVFQQLGKVYEQIQLGSYPYTDADYNFKRLREGIESVLRAIGINAHVQEYGDEEEDFKPYEYPACFAPGMFEFREDRYEEGFNVYTLIKYGDRKTVLIKRVHVNRLGHITEERIVHKHSRSPIGCMLPSDVINAFN